MIYTSYFAKLRQLPDDIVPISICAKPPSWYKGLEYKVFAPTYDILMRYKRDGDKGAYTYNFYDQILSKLDGCEEESILCAMSQGKDVALLCYEKPSDFCHRHLVADWFNKYNVKAEEYNYEDCN